MGGNKAGLMLIVVIGIFTFTIIVWIGYLRQAARVEKQLDELDQARRLVELDFSSVEPVLGLDTLTAAIGLALDQYSDDQLVRIRSQLIYDQPVLTVVNEDVIYHNLDSAQLTAQDLHMLINTLSTPTTVPKVFHYILLGYTELVLSQVVSFLSSLHIAKADFIIFWYDELPEDELWNYFITNVTNDELNWKILFARLQPILSIYDKPVDVVEHKADIARLEILYVFGGIYIDTDFVVVKPIDEFLDYNLTMSIPADPNFLSNGIILAIKNHPFIKYWHLGYQAFIDELWGEFSVRLPGQRSKDLGIEPLTRLNKLVPYQVHTERTRLSKPYWNESHLVYQTTLSKWQRYDWTNSSVINLTARAQRLYAKTDQNFYSIRFEHSLYGEVSRFVLFGRKQLFCDTDQEL